MKKIAALVLSMVALAAGALLLNPNLRAQAEDIVTDSLLYKEFTKRELLLLSPYQAQIINLLQQIKTPAFDTSDVIEFEMLSDANREFLMKTKGNDVCYGLLGNLSKMFVRCLNQAGITAYSLGGTDPITTINSTSALGQEFLKRNAIELSADQKKAIEFMIFHNFIDPGKILKLEILDPVLGVFVLETKGDDYCLGSQDKEMLRCKNAAGITIVGFAGDAD